MLKRKKIICTAFSFYNDSLILLDFVEAVVPELVEEPTVVELPVNCVVEIVLAEPRIDERRLSSLINIVLDDNCKLVLIIRKQILSITLLRYFLTLTDKRC